MLTALELENFKGIAARQRIAFAPITLLFGANSAGKSTILQSLLYLHELIERGGADVDRTELGGQVVELGGFARLVHRHETSRAIVIRAEFPTTGSLERFGRADEEIAFPDLDDATESAWLELTIRERTTAAFRGPIVDRVVIGLGTEVEPLVWLETGHSLRDGEWLNAGVNMGHPALGAGTAELVPGWEDIALPQGLLHHEAEDEGGGHGGGSGTGAGTGDGWGFADGRSVPVFALARSRMSALPPLSEPLRVILVGDEETPERTAAALQVRAFLEMVVLGTTAQLAAVLKSALYIGPLRTIPPRGLLYERAARRSSWADGLAAWELLLADRSSLMDRTNQWLEKLGAGCEVVVQQLFEPSSSAENQASEHADETVRRLILRTDSAQSVLPAEVGAGISQLIPVVVAALVPKITKLVVIEQPELHVHPALQAKLGDLLIRASHKRMFVIETHSEHLILRLLRRIREASEQASGMDGDIKTRLDDVPAFPPEMLSVLYVQNASSGVTVQRLRVDATGEFVDRWPNGFFEERAEELF